MSQASIGIGQAVAHADATSPSWSTLAYAVLVSFMTTRGGEGFTAPDVREFADKCGLPLPPSKRAWGGPFRTAQKNGVIRHVDYVRASDEMHHQPIRVWRAVA